MNNLELKSAAKASVAHVMGPLACMALDVGLSATDFAEIARNEFVRAAVEKGASSNPPATSDSDIAIVTGLARRDVAALVERLREQAIDDVERSDVGRHTAELVLSAWGNDPTFHKNGSPAPLPIRGGSVSWGALVRKHAAQPRPRSILAELERVKAVRRNAEGTVVEMIRRTYAPKTFSPEGLREVGRMGRDLLRTLLHNLRHPKRQLYQRQVANSILTPGQAAIITRFAIQQADALMDTLESSLNDPPADGSDVSKLNHVRLGVELHLIREPIEDDLNLPTPASLPSRESKRGRLKVTRDRRTTKD